MTGVVADFWMEIDSLRDQLSFTLFDDPFWGPDVHFTHQPFIEAVMNRESGVFSDDGNGIKSEGFLCNEVRNSPNSVMPRVINFACGVVKLFFQPANGIRIRRLAAVKIPLGERLDGLEVENPFIGQVAAITNLSFDGPNEFLVILNAGLFFFFHVPFECPDDEGNKIVNEFRAFIFLGDEFISLESLEKFTA